MAGQIHGELHAYAIEARQRKKPAMPTPAPTIVSPNQCAP